MGRFLTLLMVTVALSQPPKTLGDFNGLNWRDLAQHDKTNMMLGVMMGSAAERLMHSEKATAHSSNRPLDLVRELDTFYGVGANAPIPVWVALTWVFSKSDGAPKEELDTILKALRKGLHLQ